MAKAVPVIWGALRFDSMYQLARQLRCHSQLISRAIERGELLRGLTIRYAPEVIEERAAKAHERKASVIAQWYKRHRFDGGRRRIMRVTQGERLLRRKMLGPGACRG